MSNPLTERALTGVKGTAGNARGTSGRRTKGGCACSRLGARDVVETDRAQFTVQRRCCDRKAAGEEEVPRAETIYLGHEEQLEREANTSCLFPRPSRTRGRTDPCQSRPTELPSAHGCGSISH